MLFRTLDLFSGIGGITYALNDLLNVMMYCEINDDANKVLKCRMKTNHIQTAPIVEDVRNTTEILKIVGNSKIDLVIASSSCVGFSLAGSRKGLENVETGLMIDTLNLIKQIRPNMVFMENVPGIISVNDGKDFDRLIKEMDSYGYKCHWDISSANDVGAWHIRKRWFGLFVLDGYDMPHLPLNSTYKTYEPWLHHDIGIKKAKFRCPSDSKRLKLLGNSVVPDCIRKSFFALYSRYLNIVFPPFPTGIVAVKSLNLIIDPNKSGISKSNRKRNITSPLILSEKKLNYYPTPRSKNISCSCILTLRGSKDLGSVIKFEKGTEWQDNYVMNPEFVEFLMGYPLNFTFVNV